MELFILIGGCYALYTVGMAIATNIDYYSTEKEAKLVKGESTDSMTIKLLAHLLVALLPLVTTIVV